MRRIGRQLFIIIVLSGFLRLAWLDLRGNKLNRRSVVRRKPEIWDFVTHIQNVLGATIDVHISQDRAHPYANYSKAISGCLRKWHAFLYSESAPDNTETSAGNATSAADCNLATQGNASDPPAIRLCRMLSGKTLLLVGPESTYRFHSALLQAVANLSHSRATLCPGDESCSFHHVCQQAADSNTDANQDDRFNTTHHVDSRIWRPPLQEELIASNSSLIRYAFSHSLYVPLNLSGATNNPVYPDRRFDLPYVDPDTGVRVKETNWLFKGKRADIVVLSRGPVHAPAWSYDGTSYGNWTFVDSLAAHAHSAGLDSSVLLNANGFQRLLYAALTITVIKWLPEVLNALNTARTESILGRKLLIWTSSSPAILNFSSACVHQDLRLPLDWTNADVVTDPWGVYHDVQGLVQAPQLPSNRRLIASHSVHSKSSHVDNRTE
jgi:hypothetical protein